LTGEFALKGCSLLIVEDDVALAAVLEEYMGESGYVVTVTHDGKRALELLDSRAFDIVLLDIMLPGVSGLSILERVGGDPRQTVVILMTGFSGIEDALHAVARGAYDFVSKPFQLPEIRVRINNAAHYQQLLRHYLSSSADPGERLPAGRDGTDVKVRGDVALRVYSAARGGA